MKVGHKLQWLILVALAIAAFWGIAIYLDSLEAYLFELFHNSRAFFAYTLGLLFLIGIYGIADRTLFWISYDLFGARMDFHGESFSEFGERNFFKRYEDEMTRLRDGKRKTFESSIPESEKVVIIGEIKDAAQQKASNEALDGQELDDKCRMLEHIGVVSPIVGFIGTLVGLIESFGELAGGGETQDLLSGLGVSMATSLIGAFISVVCITAVWACRQLDDMLYDHTETIVTKGNNPTPL